MTFFKKSYNRDDIYFLSCIQYKTYLYTLRVIVDVTKRT